MPPTDSTATGNCLADLADNAASVFVQCSHNVADADGDPSSRRHRRASNGPVVFSFPTTNPFSGDAPLTPRLVADFAAGFLYVDIHSPNYDAGEIRGQLFGPAAVAPPPAPIPTLRAVGRVPDGARAGRRGVGADEVIEVRAARAAL